jgi:hypothetical protein
MNWEQEIEVEGKGGSKALVKVVDIQSALLTFLTRRDQEEFLEDLMRALS